jgi:hypothetical protein
LEPTEFVLEWIYYGVVATVAIYLAIRALQSRTYQSLFLAFAFLMKLLVQVIKPLEFNYLLRALLDFNDVPLILLYTKFMYHQRQKDHFIFTFSTILLLRVLVGVLAFAFQFDIPATRNLAGLDYAMYYLYITCGAIMTWAANGWLVYSAATIIMRRHDGGLVPVLFKLRNKWIMFGIAPYLFVPVFWFLLPTNGVGYSTNGTWSSGAMITLAGALFLWIIVSRLSRGTKQASETEARVLKEITSLDGTPNTEITEKILNQHGVMAIVNYLGDFLAISIDKPPSAAKGLILLSIQSQLGNDAVYRIKLNQILDVIHVTLKKRLDIMNILNVDETVKILSEKLVDKQALLTLMPS